MSRGHLAPATGGTATAEAWSGDRPPQCLPAPVRRRDHGPLLPGRAGRGAPGGAGRHRLGRRHRAGRRGLGTPGPALAVVDEAVAAPHRQRPGGRGLLRRGGGRPGRGRGGRVARRAHGPAAGGGRSRAGLRRGSERARPRRPGRRPRRPAGRGPGPVAADGAGLLPSGQHGRWSDDRRSRGRHRPRPLAAVGGGRHDPGLGSPGPSGARDPARRGRGCGGRHDPRRARRSPRGAPRLGGTRRWLPAVVRLHPRALRAGCRAGT